MQGDILKISKKSNKVMKETYEIALLPRCASTCVCPSSLFSA
jgi:hypothetical protein